MVDSLDLSKDNMMAAKWVDMMVGQSESWMVVQMAFLTVEDLVPMTVASREFYLDLTRVGSLDESLVGLKAVG